MLVVPDLREKVIMVSRLHVGSPRSQRKGDYGESATCWYVRDIDIGQLTTSIIP